MGEEKLPVVNQHYISQGLLKLFSENRKFVYEFNITNDKIYRAGIGSTMCGKYTYEHPFLPGNALEKAFKRIEDKYIPLIRAVVQLLEEDNVLKAKEIIEGILKYILLFYYRSGAILYEFSDNNDFTKSEVIDSLLKRIADLRYMEKLATTIIQDYAFLIVKSPEEKLALSDQYVSTASLNCKGMISSFSNRTIGFSECLILIPLSAKYYAIYYNGNFRLSKPFRNGEIYCLEQEDILALNKAIVRNSYNKCIAKHPEELEEVKFFKSKIVGPAGVIMKYADGTYHSCTIKKEVFFYDRDEDIFENHLKYFSDLASFEKEHHRHIGRNDLCPCDSGKKFKKCCQEKYQQAKFILNMIKSGQTRWLSTKSNFVEMPVNEFWGLDANLPKTPQEIVKGVNENLGKSGEKDDYPSI